MKITNGKIIIGIAAIHTAITISPFAYQKQFENFAGSYFFNLKMWNPGFSFLNGQLNYENFAAFWCFYFGLLMFPLGILVEYIETKQIKIPKQFILSYFIFTVIGIYMIPVSGMTVFFLPHSVYMMIRNQMGK